MSEQYRIERELMVPGQTEPTFRVIVRLGKSSWGRVQSGMTQDEANELCRHLLANVAAQRARLLPGSNPYASPAYLSHRRRR